jgi:hypothetical protein
MSDGVWLLLYPFNINAVSRKSWIPCPRHMCVPQLVACRPMREGYIAILFPSEAQRRMCVERLLSVEQYIQLRGLTSHDLQ